MKSFFAWIVCLFTTCGPVQEDSGVLVVVQPEAVIVESEPIREQQIDNDSIPERAHQYVDLFMETENPSRIAAQAQVESAFRKFAKSPYAVGIMQFTPDTGNWAARTFCKDLGPFRKYDEAWQIKCADKYMQWLGKRVPTTGLYCDTKQNSERAYNGGLGWINRESKKTDDHSHAGLIKVCNLTGRANWACNENITYSVKISTRQTNFKSLGGKLCV